MAPPRKRLRRHGPPDEDEFYSEERVEERTYDAWEYESSDPYAPDYSLYPQTGHEQGYQMPYVPQHPHFQQSLTSVPMLHSFSRNRISLNTFSNRPFMAHTFTPSGLPHRPSEDQIDIPTAAGSDPLPSYLQISLTPSHPLSPLPPSSLRKLLILDLNGTLLVRSQRNQASGSNNPRVRHVYPRPFMSVFRSYLFSSSTVTWLDTMVWSSAQKHNVDDMVNKCFGDEKSKLVAVWARDTLGLRHDEYHRKTQTTKDLGKPWTSLSLRPPASSEQETGSSAAIQQSHTHSALTTILLDDSTLKARLQPWNHVCIPEYTRKMRLRDLNTLRNERKTEQGDFLEDQPESSVHNKKRFRETSVESGQSGLLEHSEGYDETLLAVIGVLDAIKDESNVAGWIRAGGLRGARDSTPGGDDVDSIASSREASEDETTDPKRSAVSTAAFPTPKSDESPEMWFENSATLEYWVSRGKEAIAALGIVPDAGVRS